MAEGHGVDADERPSAIDLDRGRRARVDDRIDLVAIASEDDGIERHIDREAIELLTLDVEAEFRSQLDRSGSAVGNSVLETGDEHGSGQALDPRSDAGPDDFRRLANCAFPALMEDMKLCRLGSRRLQKSANAPPLEAHGWPEIQSPTVCLKRGVPREHLPQQALHAQHVDQGKRLARSRRGPDLVSLFDLRQFGYVVAHLKLKLDPVLGHRSNGHLRSPPVQNRRPFSSAGRKRLTRKRRRDTMPTRRARHKVSSWQTL
jgi:hypothetical protein